MNRWYSIEVIYFATLFLSLDIQTPSSSPTTFVFQFLQCQFGYVQAYIRFIDFYQSYFSRPKCLLLVFVYHRTQLYLKAALVELHMNWFPPLLSSLPSTSIPAPSHPYSYSHNLPLIEKQVSVQPVLSGHSRGMAAWPLHTGWPLCRFHRIGVLWKTL